MDGFEFNEGVIIIVVINWFDVFDLVIFWLGCFDCRIVVSCSDVCGCEVIFVIYMWCVLFVFDVEFNVIAWGTLGFVGVDLENLVNEVALFAVRQDKELCSMSDFEMSKDKVLMGIERCSMVIIDEEKCTMVWYEFGHIFVVKLLEDHIDFVHKVMIIFCGFVLGVM